MGALKLEFPGMTNVDHKHPENPAGLRTAIMNNPDSFK